MGTLAITIFPGGRPSAPYRHAESHQFTRCIQAEGVPGMVFVPCLLRGQDGVPPCLASPCWMSTCGSSRRAVDRTPVGAVLRCEGVLHCGGQAAAGDRDGRRAAVHRGATLAW